MPTVCGYRQLDDALEIVIPVSDGLIRDAIDRKAVAQMASELAAQTAHKAVIQRRIQHEKEN